MKRTYQPKTRTKRTWFYEKNENKIWKKCIKS